MSECPPYSLTPYVQWLREKEPYLGMSSTCHPGSELTPEELRGISERAYRLEVSAAHRAFFEENGQPRRK